MIAATKGTIISEVTKHPAKIPEKSRIRELIAVRDTIKSKEEYVLNYFNNRSTNAAAESLNSKMKGFRAQVRGVSDLPFFMYHMMKIFDNLSFPLKQKKSVYPILSYTDLLFSEVYFYLALAE